MRWGLKMLGVDEWLIRTVMSLYTEACTVVKTNGVFCYLGATLGGDGVADLVATVKIRNGWMKFPEILPFLTSRAPL